MGRGCWEVEEDPEEPYGLVSGLLQQGWGKTDPPTVPTITLKACFPSLTCSPRPWEKGAGWDWHLNRHIKIHLGLIYFH